MNRIPSRQLKCSEAPGSFDGLVILKSLLVFEYTLNPRSSCFQSENKKVRLYDLSGIRYFLHKIISIIDKGYFMLFNLRSTGFPSL